MINKLNDRANVREKKIPLYNEFLEYTTIFGMKNINSILNNEYV